MLYKNNQEIVAVHKGTDTIVEIYKGTDLVFAANRFFWNGNGSGEQHTSATDSMDGVYHEASSGALTTFGSFDKASGAVHLTAQSSSGEASSPSGYTGNISGYQGSPSVQPAISGISIVETARWSSSGRTWVNYSIDFNVKNMTKNQTYTMTISAGTYEFSSQHWSIGSTSATATSTFYRK